MCEQDDDDRAELRRRRGRGMIVHFVNGFTDSPAAGCCGATLALLDAAEVTLDPDAVTCRQVAAGRRVRQLERLPKPELIARCERAGTVGPLAKWSKFDLATVAARSEWFPPIRP